MTRGRCSLMPAAVGGLCSLGFVQAAWAHHPISRSDVSGGWPWALLWMLGAGVFLVVFGATLAALSIIERRQRGRSEARDSTRRS
jgi:hypothetical protein